MIRCLIKKNLREARWLLLGCTAAIFAFCWLRVWMVSQLSTDRFQAILDMLPSDWRRFLSVDLAWLVTYPGRIARVYQELIVILCMALWCIARGSDAVSGELNRGTLEMLLAQPIPRMRFLTVQCAVTLVGVAVLAAATLGGTAVGVLTNSVKEEVVAQLQLPFYIPGIGTEVPLPFGERTERFTPMSEKVDLRLFLPAAANFFSLGVLLSSFSLLMSAWDRYRWRTIGIVTGTMIVQVMLKVAGMATESTEWMRRLSILSAYEPEVFVRIADVTPESAWAFGLYDSLGNWTGFGPVAYDLLLLGLGAASLGAGAIIFSRRDLPAP